jgi:anti-sigma B factor antagonist
MMPAMGARTEPPFEVKCERQPSDAVVIVVQGELDLVTAETLREALSSDEAQAPVAVLDLRSVGFIDSSGLSVVVEYHKRARAAGTECAVAVGGASRVRRLLALSGLSETLDLVDEPADVIASGPRPGGV